MRQLIVLGVIFFFSFQTKGQQLTMYHTFGGAHFEFERDTMVYQVSARQVAQILYDYPDAYKEFKKARTSNTIAGIMGFSGAGLMILPLASAISGGEPEWAFLAGGAALVIGSLPISTNYRRRAQNAVDMYNQKYSSMRPRTQFFVSATGARLIIRF